jgi:hypothetical protein
MVASQPCDAVGSDVISKIAEQQKSLSKADRDTAFGKPTRAGQGEPEAAHGEDLR